MSSIEYTYYGVPFNIGDRLLAESSDKGFEQIEFTVHNNMGETVEAIKKLGLDEGVPSYELRYHGLQIHGFGDYHADKITVLPNRSHAIEYHDLEHIPLTEIKAGDIIVCKKNKYSCLVKFEVTESNLIVNSEGVFVYAPNSDMEFHFMPEGNDTFLGKAPPTQNFKAT